MMEALAALGWRFFLSSATVQIGFDPVQHIYPRERVWGALYAFLSSHVCECECSFYSLYYARVRSHLNAVLCGWQPTGDIGTRPRKALTLTVQMRYDIIDNNKLSDLIAYNFFNRSISIYFQKRATRFGWELWSLKAKITEIAVIRNIYGKWYKSDLKKEKMDDYKSRICAE